MACAMQSFNNVEANVWTCIVQKLAQQGIDITGPSGTQSKGGYTVWWNYDGSTLQVQVTQHPPILPTCSMINGKIHDEIEECMKTHNVAISDMGQ